MLISVNDFLSKKIEEILSKSNTKEIEELLDESLEEVIKQFSEIIKAKPLFEKRKISIGTAKKEYGVNFGIKKTLEKLTIADWLFDLQIKIKSYVLYFLIIKESILHFINIKMDDVNQTIINIITFLWLKELMEIETIDNPIYAALSSRIYPEEIGGKGYSYWNNLLTLLFSKNISFIETYNAFCEIVKNESISPEEVDNNFSNWVIQKTIKEEDVVAPIYLYPKQIEVLDTIVELGYERGSSALVSKKLKMHINTVRKHFRDLMTSYATFWRAKINYERLQLNNYFLKVILKEEKTKDQLMQMLSGIPYLRTIFQGTDDENIILYSPTLFSPHIIAEQLGEKLQSLKNKNQIEEFNVQLIRGKKRYGAVSSVPIQPTIESFQKLIDNEQENLTKYSFSEAKRDFSLEFDDTLVTLNPNILFFLSIITGKFLLKARYTVKVNELPKYYELNNIAISDVDAQTNLINQTETQARKKGLLDYDLYMRNFAKPSSETLIIELLGEQTTDHTNIDNVIDSLRVFSFLGQTDLYDKKILTLSGISHKHPISKLIKTNLDKNNINSNIYSISLAKAKNLSLHELFDFDEKKWKII